MAPLSFSTRPDTRFIPGNNLAPMIIEIPAEFKSLIIDLAVNAAALE